MTDTQRHNIRVFRRMFRLQGREERAEFREMIRAEPMLAVKWWGARLPLPETATA
ncbi:hypothetical protein [Methylorubrum sp. SB2]|uniref:hypothetical protein n=1 Tax=Methylorubrum subtropicum TaxID=3138812 RepID=UPI00313B1D07